MTALPETHSVAGTHALRRALRAAIALTALHCGAMAVAQEVPQAEQVVIAESGQGSDHTGRLAVNVAAGDQNQQLASAVIAIGEIAATSEVVVQKAAAGGPDEATSLVISGTAFSGNSGLVSLNLTAGSQNQSANLASFAIGQSGALTDQLLEQSRAPTQPSGGTQAASATRNDTVAISDDAFGDGSGLFQANLIGGERNSSANTFSLIVSAGNPE